ncbi:MAG TPA: tetratricopeptide repeat protein [bacterium]|nr:tetratricopeptide repeat protein [bacterium]
MKAKLSAIFILFIITLLLTAPSAAQEFDPSVLNNRGVEFYERGNYQAAVEAFESVLMLDPDNVDVYLNLGYTYQAAGIHEAAVSAFKEALKLDPGNINAHNSLGVSLFTIGETERAMEEWNFILSMDPSFADAAANLTMAKHPENASEIRSHTINAKRIDALERANVKKSTTPSSKSLDEMFARGKQYFLEGDFRMSEKLMANILEVKPTSKFSYYYIGMSQAYLGKEMPAMQNLREFLILESYPPESRNAYDKAIATFKALRDGKGIVFTASKSEMRATDAFDKGKASYRGKDFFKAIHYLKDAYDLKPDSYLVNYFLGMSYKEVGDQRRATFHLTKCLLSNDSDKTPEETKKLEQLLRDLTR